MSQEQKEASASLFHSEAELAHTHHDLKRLIGDYVIDEAEYTTWLSWRIVRRLKNEGRRAELMKELDHDNQG